RLEAELLGEAAPERLVRGERLRRPAGPIEAEHQLAEQALLERVLADEPLELAPQLRAAAKRELRVEAALQRKQPAPLEPPRPPTRSAGSDARSASAGPRHKPSASRR